MDERQRLRRQGQRPDRLSVIRSIYNNDLPLAARVAGIAVSLPVAGVIGAVASALLVAPDRVALTGWALFGIAVLVALALGALTTLRRREGREAQRALLRARLALVALTLGTVAAVFSGSTSPPFISVAASVVVAVIILLTGLWSFGFVSRTAFSMATARRQAWYAQIRAARLTRRMIGYPAYRQLRRDGALPVKSLLHPNRTYLVPIRTTPSGARILVLDGERPIGGLCLRPRQPLPDPEEALTHILAIRTDERAWLDRANFFPQDRELTPQALGLAPGRPGNYER
jgi:threonine/homoserine/homoserine lactone efflux protein